MACAQSCPSPPPCNSCSVQNSYSSNGASICGLAAPSFSAPVPPSLPQYHAFNPPALPQPPVPQYAQPPSPPQPASQNNFNSYGRAPPGSNSYPVEVSKRPSFRTRPPQPLSPPPEINQDVEMQVPSHPFPDEPFYENDKAVGIPSLDEQGTTGRGRSSPSTPFAPSTVPKQSRQ
ncbi:hypothetical protein L596_011176 [Steinernema carpocapsae]|nr:hypothetical protein L596_011176 [Steinernema carpocapsae]